MKGTMKALWYSAPRTFEIREVPIPQINDDEVLLKGVCGTDGHIDELIPGHEAIGVIVEMGENVKGFSLGDRCVADVGITCETCFYCRRGQSLLCENFQACGVTQDGGFAEYIKYQQKKLYKIQNLTDEESTLLEPAACAIHGLDKLSPPVGIDVLLLGAGPTGLILAQLLKLNGASRVVIAANKGIKMDIAKKLNAADERGGTLMIYGVYENKALVHWPPSKIFGDEIKIIGSFSQTFCFPRAVAYLDSGKINVKGMVTDIFKLEDYQAALDKMNSRTALKIAIKP
ncbi:unnamed protein product [Cyclocybe aegerita]|uniref:Alcohol dehydrogenase-like N-terminal domain-containing protein n=1 Tax=Cyclocybe aegerita TaxID=1973307 RepID=A0A8S0WXP3_CYCAE|nr:unnamed protein product [Cyclocybe aegerita]